MTDRQRATSLSPPDMYKLRLFARAVGEAFEGTVYLVGSVARAEKDYRDVDLRLMLDDDSFARFDPEELTTMNVAFSNWGKYMTGLPIDFQFQDTTEANREHDGPRHLLVWIVRRRDLEPHETD